MPRFEDAPLGKDLFRLFKLKQRSNDIELEVQTFKIYRAPKYEAISYCWGDESDGVVTIRCNGKPLKVWDNLHTALCRLLRENTASWFWVDAVCIEQGDSEVAVTEKRQQIAFMETIFLLADPVRVWLGDASEREENVFQFFAHASETLTSDAVHIRKALRFPDQRDEMWRSWSQIIIRPWFARLWTVQEALVSNGNVVVTLGKESRTTWKNFREIIDRTSAIAWTDEPMSYSALDARGKRCVNRDFFLEWGVDLDTHVSQNQSYSHDRALQGCVFRNIVNIREMLFLEKYHDANFGFLQQVLKVYGNRKCTYNQDRPNAMQGVLTNQLKKGLRVYDIDEDITKVYLEATRVWLSNDPTLSLLQRIRPRAKFLPGEDEVTGSRLRQPSWVIDLGRVVTEALGDGIPHRSDGFHAGLQRSSSISGKPEWVVPGSGLMGRIKKTKSVTFPSEAECHISGVDVGSVEFVLPPWSDHARLDLKQTNTLSEQGPACAKRIRDSLTLVQRALGQDPELAKEAHWRVLVLNQTDVWDPAVQTMFDVEDKYSRRQAYDEFQDILESGEFERLSKLQGTTERYSSSAMRLLSNFPNWFCTSTGHVGRSYSIPRPGDVLAIFNGAATPFLLRPVLGRDTFELMGEAYAHGVMQGEALLEKNQAKYTKKLFKLV